MKDESLVILGLKGGDENAYSYLFDTYYNYLCNIANLSVHDNFIAKSIVNDTIYHIWEIKEKIDITTSLKNYLIRAVQNSCINYLKKEYLKRESVSLEDNMLSIEFANRCDLYSDELLMTNELQDQIQKAIDHLPEECRAVFCLSRFENCTYDEISERLNVSVNTVKYHMKNAIIKLKNELSCYLTLFLIIILSFYKK